MLLHFVAHKGKYRLLSDKFGITRSCYFNCVEEMTELLSGELLRKHIYWPCSDRQKEMSDYYLQRFSFPGVIGAVDGTHITISKPPGQQFAEDYFSVRKKMYTILLQVHKQNFWTLFQCVVCSLAPNIHNSCLYSFS